ncbi:peptidase inhibitor family I36 protein [Actinomadura verrucosospora]
MRMRSMAAVGVLAGALTVGVTGTAQAAAQNGVCEPGEVCFFWGSNLWGSLSDFSAPVGDFAPYRFISPAPGQGQGVKNNAASVWNRTGLNVHVCYSEWYNGSSDWVGYQSWRNLNYTLNDNASFRFV